MALEANAIAQALRVPEVKLRANDRAGAMRKDARMATPGPVTTYDNEGIRGTTTTYGAPADLRGQAKKDAYAAANPMPTNPMAEGVVNGFRDMAAGGAQGVAQGGLPAPFAMFAPQGAMNRPAATPGASTGAQPAPFPIPMGQPPMPWHGQQGTPPTGPAPAQQPMWAPQPSTPATPQPLQSQIGSAWRGALSGNADPAAIGGAWKTAMGRKGGQTQAPAAPKYYGS